MPVRFPVPSLAVDAQRRAAILQEIDGGARLGRNYIVLVLLSCVIATVGLVQNSGAVIIGAMLIAPLMGPIIAFALALVYGDPRRVVRSLSTLLVGGMTAVALSAALGRLVGAVGTFDFSLLGLPAEILSRTQPTLFDLAVALAGGTAAAYALVQPRLSAALAGVAIATALMPPLCVVGIGLSQGQLAIWGGALILFLTNFAAIVFSGSAIFALAGFLPESSARRHPLLSGARLVNLLLLLPVAILLTAFTINIARQAQQSAAIRGTLNQALRPYRHASLVNVDQTTEGDALSIVATVRSPISLTLGEARTIEAALAARLRQRVALQLLVVPLTSLDPLNPPTFTPTATSASTGTSTAQPSAPFRGTPEPPSSPQRIAPTTGLAPAMIPTGRTPRPSPRSPPQATRSLIATATSISSATYTPRPSATVIPPEAPPATMTATPSPSAIPTASRTPRPSATPSATGTPLPAATTTRTPSATPTQTPVPTATPIAYAVVGGTGGLGVYARRSPGLAAAVVAALPDGILVQRTGRQVRRDGYIWVQVVLSDGRVVWIPQVYLVSYRTYRLPEQ